jgi:LPS sulfotransferase NodH
MESAEGGGKAERKKNPLLGRRYRSTPCHLTWIIRHICSCGIRQSLRRIDSIFLNPGVPFAMSECSLSDHLRDSRILPFVVLSRSRTGSNLLVSLLNSHPNVHADFEIFRSLNCLSYTDIFKSIFNVKRTAIKAQGFKLFYYHPLDCSCSELWEDLVSWKKLHVIHLKRRNVFRTIVSQKIASTQNIWWSICSDCKPVNVVDKAVYFTPEELEGKFRKTVDRQERAYNMFKWHPMICVYYEDLVNERNGTFCRVAEFVGVKYREPSTNFRKQNPERLDELVINYPELKQAFAGTQWEAYFDE